MQAVIHNNNKILSVIKNVKIFTENSFFGDGSIESINENLSVIFIEDENLEIIYGREIEEENTDLKTLLSLDIKPQKDSEKKLAEIRTKRNQLLVETDYLMMPDYPISEEKKQKFNQYRQALRDLTKSIDINNVVYPIKPEGEI